MCFWHKWSKWKEYIETGIKTHVWSHSSREYSENRQKRYCLKCGYVEDELINEGGKRMKRVFIICLIFGNGIALGLGWNTSCNEESEFCDGLYLGVLGATHKAFEYNTVKKCSKDNPTLERLIKENVRAIHSNDYCGKSAMFGSYPKVDTNKAICKHYTCNPDGEMTGMTMEVLNDT